MKDEFEMTMRIMGCTDLSQLHPALFNLCDVGNWCSESSQLISLRSKSKL